MRRGAAKEGAPLLREALAIRAKGGSAKLGQTLHNLAGALAETATDDTGRREAVDAYRRALRVRASSYGAKSPEVAATHAAALLVGCQRCRGCSLVVGFPRRGQTLDEVCGAVLPWWRRTRGDAVT